MLDNTTKKNIDDCRDVLVGKVPDPKSQIEQITLALIYKFMDDMDNEAVEKFKGKPKFFTGEYSKYGWRKLFDPALSGADMLALYSEALDKLNTNPNIPELFRNIFKNAYLPYRDPATLKLFLKHINAFEYSHSEKLGDAFEYLLSVMGSQGDAGQFRTPRHIIDFVTACVDPQKGETVLDPACGTAGFLLSAYKHILNQNTDKRQGDKLKPEERKKLSENIVGYDISPDMVRLSLANMYLHGFSTPEIHEYDTLSSEDRWNETYDVILANPPFMTPKGGIRPHKKFGVQANKAEVLFTDYIAEHLNQNGRAGIVVPNGIVATSQTAYKQLRRMLVEDSLIAVISLPAGCFNPYSGVKTSVLILDKALSKKTDKILFLKIENDGYDLGAQRREHDKNDLPLALLTLNSFKKSLQDGSEMKELPELATFVDRKVILENKEVILSGDRFKKPDNITSEFEWLKIEEISEYFGDGDWIERKDQSENGIRLIQTGNVGIGEYIDKEDKSRFISEETFNRLKCTEIIEGDVLVSRLPDPVGRACIVPKLKDRMITSVDCTIIRFKKNILLPELFVAYSKTSAYYEKLKNFISGASRDRISRKNLGQIEVPVPPLEIQQQIVAEIESYQKIIDGARQVVDNYKPVIKIKPEWEMVELGEVAKVRGGYAFKSEEFIESGIQVLKIGNVKPGKLDLEKNKAFISVNRKQDYNKFLIKKGDVLITMTGTEGKRDYGNVCLVKEDGDFLLNQRVGKIEINSTIVINEYLSLIMMSPMYQDEIFKKATGVRQSNVSGTDLEEIHIPLPSIEEQKSIVSTINQESKYVSACNKLISLYEQKIKDRINEVWGVSEDLTHNNKLLNKPAESAGNY